MCVSRFQPHEQFRLRRSALHELSFLRQIAHQDFAADVYKRQVQGQRLREIAGRAIDEVGRLARGLHPTVLDDHGLGVALGRYVAEYAKSHKIAVELSLNELDLSNLPSGVQITIYRILQEALTNVAKHSGARTVSIRFARMPGAIEVTVADDGCGFDTKAVAVSSCLLYTSRCV